MHFQTPPALRGLWKNRIFRFFWMASTLSSLGTSAYVMALTWMTARFYGAHGIALLALGYGIPQLMLELFGGAAADRLPRRRAFALTQSTLLLVAIVLWLVSTRTLVPLGLLVFVSACNGVISSLDTPARSALIAEMVPSEELVSAQQLFTTSSQLTNVFGPALGGVLLSTGGGAHANEQAAFLFNVLSYVPVVLCIQLLPRPGLSAVKRRRGWRADHVLQEIGQGLAYVRDRRDLVLLMQLLAVVMVLGGPFQQLLPVFVHDSVALGSSHAIYAALLSALGLGGFLGSLLGVAVAEHPQRWLALLLGSLGLGGAIMLFAGSKVIHWASLSSLLVGACSIFTINLDTALSSGMTPLGMQGRVSSITSLGKGLQSLSAAALSETIALLGGVMGRNQAAGLILSLMAAGLIAATLWLWRPLVTQAKT
jgi:MFS family permease